MASPTKKQKTEQKSVLLLGSGMCCRPVIHYLSEKGYIVHVGSRTVKKTQAAVDGAANAVAIELDIETPQGEAKMDEILPQVDAVLSLLPYVFHPKAAAYALKYGKHFFTTSYESDAMRQLGPEAQAKGLVFINECGVDPGTDHMSAMRIIDAVRKRGGEITSFTSYCGGLPAPEDNNNPLGYKLSWAPRGVLLASRNTAHFLKDGKDVTIPGEVLFDNYQEFEIPDLGVFEGYPNRNSKQYIDVYGIQSTQTIIRGTFRNKGWCGQIKKLVELGYLSVDSADLKGTTYEALLQSLLQSSAVGDELLEAARAKLGVDSSHPVLSSIKWLGLLESAPIPSHVKSPLDALCAKMEEKMQYAPGERDMLLMQHKFIAQFPDHSKEEITSTLVDYGVKNGDTSMSRTVSLPLGIVTRLVLEGHFTKPGLTIPICPELYNPILDELEHDFNIIFKEHTKPL